MPNEPSDEKEEELLIDRLCSGDRPSIFIAGVALGRALQELDIAVFTTDILGRVVIMPPASIKIIHHHKIKDQDLNLFKEEEAIDIMLKEGRSESEIVKYLEQRNIGQSSDGS